MRTLEIRRHSMRQKPAETLSDAGVKLAQYVAQTSLTNLHFDRVITSAIPRAIYTANAMGFEVDNTIEALGILPADVLKKINWPCSFVDAANTAAADKSCSLFAKVQAKLWQDILLQAPHNTSTLVITHGAFIELAVSAYTSILTDTTLDKTIGYCEGITLHYDNGHYHIQPLRVPTDKYLIDS